MAIALRNLFQFISNFVWRQRSFCVILYSYLYICLAIFHCFCIELCKIKTRCLTIRRTNFPIPQDKREIKICEQHFLLFPSVSYFHNIFMLPPNAVTIKLSPSSLTMRALLSATSRSFLTSTTRIAASTTRILGRY